LLSSSSHRPSTSSLLPLPLPDALPIFAADIFAARDVPRDDAEWIATLLVRANLRGHDSHGVIRVPQYCAALKSGHLNPAPKIQLDRKSTRLNSSHLGISYDVFCL